MISSGRTIDLHYLLKHKQNGKNVGVIYDWNLFYCIKVAELVRLLEVCNMVLLTDSNFMKANMFPSRVILVTA